MKKVAEAQKFYTKGKKVVEQVFGTKHELFK